MSGPSAPGGPHRLAFLDAARGVAAAVVVLAHVLEHQSQAFLDTSLKSVNLGRVGVVAFFLVSGYVISLSLDKQDQRTFWTRRFWRLYPPYWFALALFLLVSADGFDVGAVDLAVNLTMLQGLVGAPLLLGVSWTLGIELLFYAQQAAAKAAGLLQQAVHLGWFWLAAFLGLAVVTSVTGRDTPLALPLMLYTASLGQALYLRERGRGGPFWPMLVAGVVLEPVGSVLGVVGRDGDWYPSGYALSYLVGLLLFGAFYALRRVSFPSYLVTLGTVSYALYLVHPAVVEASRRLYGRQDWLLVAVQLPLALLVAVAVYRFVEEPSIERGRRATARRPDVAAEDPPALRS